MNKVIWNNIIDKNKKAMSNKIYHSLRKVLLYLPLSLLLAACTQDELAEQAGILPEGKYPLQIGSVSITADVDGQPWSAGAPQTRVRENDDRNSSRWNWNETIGVQIEGSTKSGIYYLYGDYSLTPITPVYWENTQAHKVRAWFPADGNVALNNQTTDLAYALYAKTAEAVDYKAGKIPLSFDHKLAKVRVKLEGEKAADAKSVEIKTYTSCTLGADGTLTAGGTKDFIPMVKATYNGETFWEANVMPGHIIKEFRLNGTEGTLSDDSFRPVAGMINTINIKASKSPIPEDAIPISGIYNISDDGNYILTGKLDGCQIYIGSGNPHIYLKDADISLNLDWKTPIYIQNGNTTIHVIGGNNTIKSDNSAGIYVHKSSTVTITGRSREDKLTVTGGNGCCGIGGFTSIGSDDGGYCGNIRISNVTVYAYGSINNRTGVASAGIGSVGNASCGDITIENATVHTYGVATSDGRYTSGMGRGFPASGVPTAVPNITISGSEIHAHRGGSTADYIGWGNNEAGETAGNGAITLGNGICKSSTVHCYTGDTLDKTVTYDASGQ